MKVQLEDKELILLVKANNYEAFELLYKRYASKLYSFSLRILKDKVEAEEIVQDTFLKIWEKRLEIKEDLTFNTYLVTVGKHKIYNFFRRKLVQQKYDSSLPKDLELSEEDADAHIEDLRTLMLQKIARLPERQREIMLLKLEGMSNEEIADSFQLSKKTVENHVNRAYTVLRAELGDWKSLLPLLLFINSNLF